MSEPSVDPVPGTDEFYRLPVEEQLRVCEEQVGVFRDGTEIRGAFATRPRPYTGSDPLPNPIDAWRF